MSVINQTPPDDMSINEQTAWKEGHFAGLMDAASLRDPVVVIIEGGLVQAVTTPADVLPAPVVVIDYDARDTLTNNDAEGVDQVPQGNGETEPAWVSVFRVGPTQMIEDIAEFVRREVSNDAAEDTAEAGSGTNGLSADQDDE